MSWVVIIGLGRGPIGPIRDGGELWNCILAALLAAGVDEGEAKQQSDAMWAKVGESSDVWTANLPDGREIAVWREGEK